jgi:hypothetical protein
MFEQRLEYSPGTHNYRANEWQVDVFGTWGSLDREDFDDDSMGFGLGGGYFFTRYLGVGVETYVEDFEAPNHVDFSVIGRYPLQFLGMAPYALAGVGRQFEDVSQWTGHIGGGAEFRLNPTTGLFTDIRGVFAEDTEDIALIRFGIRLAF